MMMMMGEGVSVPPSFHHLPMSGPSGVDVGGGAAGDEMTTCLPCCGTIAEDDEEAAVKATAVDAYACDEFLMYEFKVPRLDGLPLLAPGEEDAP
ncbi:hypothetical protein ACP70R_044442 [Stipagrostis hirtigluma subsp. patula]